MNKDNVHPVWLLFAFALGMLVGMIIYPSAVGPIHRPNWGPHREITNPEPLK